jgi:hypothetical protein
MNDLINNQLFFKNALMQKIVLGDDTKVMNKSVNAFLEEWKTKVKSNSNLIFQLSEDGDNFIPFPDLQKELVLYSNASLCSFAEPLKKKQELCTLLDNKLPARGIVQVYFRVTQYLEEVWSQM